MGMNSVDMYHVSCLENGTIKYKRTKTKDRRSDEAYIEVRVHPYIQPLMEKWKGQDRIFRFLPTSGEIQSAASDKISHSRVC